MDERKYSLVITIINRGFADKVMDAARDAGARGGTIIYGHGAGLHEAETFFGISIHPEKELVLILAETETKNAIMQAIAKKVGMTAEGAGISFSLPVTNVVGIANINKFDDKKD